MSSDNTEDNARAIYEESRAKLQAIIDDLEVETTRRRRGGMSAQRSRD